MKRFRMVMLVMALALLAAYAAPAQAAVGPLVTFEVLNPPPGGVLDLAVGEEYTFDILVTSDTEFIIAMALTDAYYPGRGVFWNGSDRQTHAYEAELELTIKGKEPTADLPAVGDWPEPGDTWPDGVAPVGIAVGVRFHGGAVIGERFSFAVEVS